MIKRAEISSRTSCLNMAADDEPIFVLRANDELAPNTIRSWAVNYRNSKGGLDKMTDKQRKKWEDAMELAASMERWYKYYSAARTG